MTIRFAMVGLDHWYNAFPTLDAILKHPACELVAIAHRDVDRAAETAARYGDPRIATAGDILADNTVDAVCSFLSADENAALCIRAAQAGKHLIAIKPMAMTLAEADEVVAAVEHAGITYIPNDSARRFTPANVRFHEWLGEGRIGDLLAVHCVFRAGLPQEWPGATSPGWFAEPARVPGGAFIDHAVYHVDVLRWLFGAEVESVTGVTANVRYPELPLEDWGHGIFRFPGGRVGTIEDTWTSGPGAPREAIELVGSQGSLLFDTATGRMTINGDFGLGGWIQALPPRGPGIMDYAIACLAGEREPATTVRDARANLAACLAFYESARTGRTVEVISRE